MVFVYMILFIYKVFAHGLSYKLFYLIKNVKKKTQKLTHFLQV